MRRCIVAAAMTLLCVTAAWGAEIPQSVTDAVPPEAAGLLQDVGNTADHETLWAGLSDLWHSACAYVRTALESRVSGAAVLPCAKRRLNPSSGSWKDSIFLIISVRV